MSNNFSFPPPPPPPPRSASEFTESSFSHSRVGRGGRGTSRGRGNADSNRGQRGGHDSRSSNPNYQSIGPGNYHGRGRGTFGGGSGDSFRGQKRKRDDFGSNARPYSKPKVEAAPAVPSFGAALPLFSASSNINNFSRITAPLPAKADQTKRKGNQLGLTPLVDYGEESEDEDGNDDEDISRASFQNPLQIEFNGKTTDLASPSAMAAWLAERKAKWPTTSRVAEKKREQLKKEQDLLRRRLDADKARKAAQQGSSSQEVNKTLTATPAEVGSLQPVDRDAKAKKSLEKHLARVESLKRKLEKSQARTASAPFHSDDAPSRDTAINNVLRKAGADDEPVTAEDLSDIAVMITPVSEESSDVPSSSSSDTDCSESEAESDLSAPPKTVSSKTRETTDEPRPEVLREQRGPKLCRQFAAHGNCPRGKRCHFKHEGESRPQKSTTKKEPMQPPKRKSLFQRLVDQEIETENRRALELIKYMGENGYLEATPKQ